jgi:hypothetical protein
MIKKTLIVLFIVLINQICVCQEIRIKGHVYDVDTKETIAFASIKLFVQDSLINSSISDLEGLYYNVSSVMLKKNQSLYFIVSTTGYEEKKIVFRYKKCVQIFDVDLKKRK